MTTRRSTGDVNPISAAKDFRRVLSRARESVQPRAFPWYPYESLDSIIHQVGPFLTDGLIEEVRRLPLLDLGCGDGDLSFLFESLGFRVTAVDHELTSNNQMQGVRALKAALKSSVSLQSADLDGRFHIAGGPFGMALLFGVLYHIKDPFYLLEYTARIARYCLLTTRIAQRTPRGCDIRNESVAYLVDSAELNGDSTNYWIFSEAGLRRLMAKTGWTILRFDSTGCREGSDLTSARDERACCLLQSRITNGSRISLGPGWHELENGTFRWTAREFSVNLKESARPGARLAFRFALAPELAGTPVTLSATANGIPLASRSYVTAGEHAYEPPLPAALYGTSGIEFRFAVDQGPRPENDQRELGLLVHFWKDGVETRDDNLPLYLRY